MTVKYIYHYDQNGYYTSRGEATKNPLDPGFLLPAHATFVKPYPAAHPDTRPKWNGHRWTYEVIHHEPVLTPEQIALENLNKLKTEMQWKVEARKNDRYSADMSITNSVGNIISLKIDPYLIGTYPGMFEACLSFLEGDHSDRAPDHNNLHIDWVDKNGETIHLTKDDLGNLRDDLILRLSDTLIYTSRLTRELKETTTIEEVDDWVKRNNIH